MSELKIGMENTVSLKVGIADTAKEMESGTLEVLATPRVSALMEKAACELIQPYLDDGITTVGTMISVSHISASPTGADITAKAVLKEIDGRKYTFEISAYDNAGLIANGTHERFSVKISSFMQRTNSKLEK